MKQYIDKAVVVEKIESYISSFCDRNGYLEDAETNSLAYETLCDLKDDINTIEVIEVDLNREIEKEIETRWHGEYLFTEKFKESDKHFFELGLNVSNPTFQNAQDIIKKYVSDHADCRWLEASELEKLLNDFVLEYDVIKNGEYEQQCKVSNNWNNR